MRDAVRADPAEEALGPGREFDLIRRLVAAWGSRAQGIGDDAAMVSVPPNEHLVASIDASLEGVHFERAWLSPREIGYRAAAAALSDLAAMASTPLGMLVALSLRDDQPADVTSLAEGIGEAAASCDCPIIGGDSTRGPCLTLTITVLGHAARPVRRDGARPGQLLYVTGTLGGSGAALEAFLRGTTPVPAHREKFARPIPRLREARWLAEHGASAMIDVSDGVASDLAHLAAASGVAMEVAMERLPCVTGVDPVRAVLSGEEYELLCAAPPLDTAEFSRSFGISLTCIGSVTRADIAAATFTLHGERVDPGLGYDHFSR
jgi:thiamine-monophosphate kinase